MKTNTLSNYFGQKLTTVNLEDLVNVRFNRHADKLDVEKLIKVWDYNKVDPLEVLPKNEKGLYPVASGKLRLACFHELNLPKNAQIPVRILTESFENNVELAERMISNNNCNRRNQNNHTFWMLAEAGDKKRMDFVRKMRDAGITVQGKKEKLKPLDGNLRFPGRAFLQFELYPTKTNLITDTTDFLKKYFTREKSGKIDLKILESEMFAGVVRFLGTTKKTNFDALNNLEAINIEQMATLRSKKLTSGGKQFAVCKVLEGLAKK